MEGRTEADDCENRLGRRGEGDERVNNPGYRDRLIRPCVHHIVTHEYDMQIISAGSRKGNKTPSPVL
jgi:hypothetical protein